ncbi:MAG: hypothetical protein HYU66_27840 [Armatimonadetes bacterium]|nr:hypothetical protein [Armatimonadota bacterium]
MTRGSSLAPLPLLCAVLACTRELPPDPALKNLDIRRASAAERPRSTYQPRPLPSGPKTPTQKSLGALWRSFEERAWLGAYRRGSRRDPRWDAAAERFLERFVRCVTDAPAPVPVESVLASALELHRLRCDHPVVLLAMAEVLRFMQQDRLAAPLYARVVPAVDARQLDSAVAWLAPLGLVRSRPVAEFRPVERQRLLDQGTAACAEAASKPSFAPFEEHWLWWRMREDHEGPASRAVLAALQQRPRASPWIMSMVTGEIALHEAHLAERERRPTGEHARLAHDAFGAAWRLHPEYPDAAVKLITCPGEGESARLWFDRAVAADFDCPEAYELYRRSLSPAVSVAFGRECLATGRFDTGVPWQYAEALSRQLEASTGTTDAAAGRLELKRLAAGYRRTRPGLAGRAGDLADRLTANATRR